MGFLKKGGGGKGVPPDVGKEEEPVVDDVPVDDGLQYAPAKAVVEKIVKKTNDSLAASAAAASQSIDIERINARLESLSSLMKEYSERFSMLSQQIGEARAMNINNEKEIGKISAESAKAIDMVKEVEPDKLRIEYQKADMKVQQLSERIESNRQFMETVMNELKELRRSMGTFLGSDALVKLNDEVKKDLVQVQQIAAKARVHADKGEQLFIEMSKGFAENRKIAQLVSNLDTNYSSMQKDVQKIKLDFSSIVTQVDFDDFRKKIGTKIMVMEKAVADIEEMRSENQRMARLIETTLAIAKQNKSDIADVALTLGDEHVQRVGDYDEKLRSLLGILDTLAGEITALKSADSGKQSKIPVKLPPKGSDAELKNIKVNQSVASKLAPSDSGGIEKIKESQKRLMQEAKKK